MKKTRKISMIPEFLRNRKTYMLTALVFTIIGVLSLSFAFFQFADDTDLTSSNTIMVETMNISDITKTFTVTYEGNNGLIKTGILNAGFSDIYKFKVTNNYDGTYPIGINWDLVRSTLNNQNTSYTLYTCTQANYTSAIIDNVASLCTAISPNTDNYLPKTNEMHKLTSADEITIGANETQYYIAKIVINNTESGKSFNGAIRVKHRGTHTLTLNLDGGDITCDTVADMKTGDTVVLPIPSKTGYVFEGWSIGEVDSVINHYTFTMGSMDTTLTASWTANIQTFLYSGNVQIFTAPQTGTYKVEAWGASGGYATYSTTYRGGYGGYTKGDIYLEKDEKLYVYVGGMGHTISGTSSFSVTQNGNGYNGGGSSYAATNNSVGSGSGGATDIRYFNTTPTSDDLVWSSSLGLNSRIMVAGGGGASVSHIYKPDYSGIGGIGGGLTGGSGSAASSTYYSVGLGGTQTMGGKESANLGHLNMFGDFGRGGYRLSSTTYYTGPNVSGGGGYYGGGGGYYGPGGGGSSYISGHDGCNSIESSLSRIHTGSSLHYSDKYFNNTKVIDGAGYNWTIYRESLTAMPNPNGGNFGNGVGNFGNGYAKITFLSYEEKSIVEINNDKKNLNISRYYEYSGSYQIFTAPITGTYMVKLWGAAGGNATYSTSYTGGYGAYTSGEIYLIANETLYIYVGGKGHSVIGQTSFSLTPNGNGYNGGGTGAYASNNSTKGGSGGATDIRYFRTIPNNSELAWNSELGINSRIMVAGGGGGASSHVNSPSYSGNGGAAGGINGYSGIVASSIYYTMGLGATQTLGGKENVYEYPRFQYGGFGLGGYYTASGQTYVSGAYAPGGGGYYGGGAGHHGPGGGGSSYISGHIGCNSIESSLSRIHTGSSIHYSDKFFTNTTMIDGKGYSWTNVKQSSVAMPTYYGTTFASGTGNSSNGFAKISLLSETTKSSGQILTEKQQARMINDFSFLEGYQIFTVPQTGSYKIETWGASGGYATYSTSYRGGYGAYAAGNISLIKDDKLYVYTGGQGHTIKGQGVTNNLFYLTNNGNGYNGGGPANIADNNSNHSGSGGATDIRLFESSPSNENLVWYSDLGLNSRIMVAAGGGGGASHYQTPSYSGTGGSGGGLNGYNGIVANTTYYAYGLGASPIAGGKDYASLGGGGQYGNFGTGGYYQNSNTSAITSPRAPGGGGYYGGGAGYYAPGGGGSSYISGHAGCVAISNMLETITPRTPLNGCTSGTVDPTCSYHVLLGNSSSFTDTLMIDGNGYQWTTSKGSLLAMPSPYGGTYSSGVGNWGNGFARITLLN